MRIILFSDLAGAEEANHKLAFPIRVGIVRILARLTLFVRIISVLGYTSSRPTFSTTIYARRTQDETL